ncbi:MAG: ribosome maturation factor RimM [Alphaproteobacteria bacterium]
MKNLVLMGCIGKPHGLKGECYFYSYSEPPMAIFDLKPLQDKNGQVMVIENWRAVHRGFLTKWQGYDNRDAVEKILHHNIFINRQCLPSLSPKQHYQHDLLGFAVVGKDKKNIGQVAGFVNYGAGDILVIHDTKKAEYFLPFQDFAMLKIDRVKKIIFIVDEFLS